MIHFVEWIDMWSSGNLFSRWLTPSNGPTPIGVHANQFEIFAYALPDGGHLAEYLATAGPQQWAETDWYLGRLREAIAAWDKLAERAVLIVLRQAFDISQLDEQVAASFKSCPEWLS